jgi:hypothetical protein
MAEDTLPVAAADAPATDSGEAAPAAEPKRKRSSRREFILAWESSPDKEAAAAKLGVTLPSLEARASAERAKGTPLKTFPRRKPAAASIDGLSIVAEARGISVEELRAEVAAKAAAKAEAEAAEEAAKAGEQPAQG